MPMKNTSAKLERFSRPILENHLEMHYRIIEHPDDPKLKRAVGALACESLIIYATTSQFLFINFQKTKFF